MRELIKNNVQLVSIHIPKTAGTSFRTVLKENIGKRSMAKVDIYNSGRILVNDKPFEKNAFDKRIVAIHGHCSYRSLNSYFELNSSVEYITWLRDPVKRVISNYQFLNKIIADRLHEKQDENLMTRMGKSLEEFVVLEANQNVMSKFLEGADLTQFKFVGIQDDFEHELTRLSTLMSWEKVKMPQHNITGKQPLAVTNEVKELIQSLNTDDVHLYAFSSRAQKEHAI